MRYPNSSLRARRAAPRMAVTLVEMLVAIAATVVLMGAVKQVMDLLGGGMANNRATIGMMEQLRSVRQKLQSDLAGHTAQALPWQDAETGGGYIEVIEGLDDLGDDPKQPLSRMQDRRNGWPNDDNRFGDRDDIIALTVRSQGPPFVDSNDEESYVAEVIWYLKRDQQPQSGLEPLYTLHRHVELILPDDDGATTEGMLGELTKRENRMGPLQTDWGRRGQIQSGFPYELKADTPRSPNSLPALREDVVLRNVLSFDVKVWDPQAPIYADGSNEKRVMAPGDPGFTAGRTVIGLGAYVDLGYQPALSPPSHFSSLPNRPSKTLNWKTDWAVWDTWPRFYERDGVDQDGKYGPDQAYNGFDDDGINGVDDPGELETRPPYDHPLRGIRVTIRIYEPASQQVRQISVVQHFMPE